MIRIIIPFILAVCIHAELVLTPEKAVEIALKNNKQLKAAEYALKEKEQGKKEAFTGFLPRVSSTAYYRRTSDIPSFDFGGGDAPMQSTGIPALDQMLAGFSQAAEMGSLDNYSLGLSITQPIFTGLKIINSYRLSEEIFKGQEFESEKRRQLTAYGAVSMFWIAYKLERAVELSEKAEARLRKSKDDQEKRFDAKMIAEHDLLQIKAQHTKLKVGILRSRRLYKNALRKIINFLNLKPDTQIKLAYYEKEDAVQSADNLNAYIEWVNNNRPDLKQSKKKQKSLELYAKIDKSGYLPTMSAKFDYTYANPNQAVSFEDEWNDSWSVMIIATWNLFDWGAAYRKGKQAEYRHKALKEITEAQERTVVSEAIDAWEAVEESKEEYEAAKEASHAADMNYNATKLKYEQGMVTTFEFLTVESSLTSSQFSELGALVKLKLALENMKIGGLGSSQASGQGQAAGTGQGMQPAQEQSGSMQAPSGQQGQMGSQGSGMSGMMGGQ